MFRIFMAANFLGRPSYLSFANGITDNVSNATINITHEIYSGWSGISKKAEMSFINNNRSTVNRAVVIIIEEEQVLYTLGSGCNAENLK